jgi:hypothetical protein
MPPIYINTENDPKDPIFVAKLTGEQAAACEKMMRDTIVKVIEKDSTFTTNKIKNPKGYSIRLEVSKFKAEGRETSCTLSGMILEYPKLTYMKGAPGTAVVSLPFSGSATASGRFAAVDCVEAVAESLVKKALPLMKKHMAERR